MAQTTKYRVLTGLAYPDAKGNEKRVAVGDVVDDIPEKQIHGLIKDGHIELVEHGKAHDEPSAKEAKA